jgi:uncharacterized repeat protein (TIGR03806 family)
MNILGKGSIIAFCSVLAACGGESSDNNQALCEAVPAEVNWDLLLQEQATKLSEYQLFEENCNPTIAPNTGGFPYDLTTGLFTDYSSKYRFTFIPPNTSAAYSENEVLEYPVGTALVKTFALPKDTSKRGYRGESKFDDELLIETRLLIHRENGWIALPYVWDEDRKDATLHISGKAIATSVMHKGEKKDFTYAVPDIQTCKQCHQLTNTVGESDEESTMSRFIPIGPKARLLNRDLEFDTGIQNQLAYMVEQGLLTGAPEDLSEIDTIPAFSDSTDITSKTSAELESLAKGYLDINCAHCHRRTDTNDGSLKDDGKAGYSGLKLEYWRELMGNEVAHGMCKTPIAFTAEGVPFDIWPGIAEKSVIPYRMALDSAKRMPEVGRDLAHDEGIALVTAWINGMSADNCGQ